MHTEKTIGQAKKIERGDEASEEEKNEVRENPVLTHPQTQTTDPDLHARDPQKRRPDPILDKPIIPTKREPKTEQILKHKQTRERLDRNLAVRINNIQRGRDSTEHHAHDLECEEEVRPEPAVARRIRGRDAEAKQPRAAEDELGQDEHEAEFGLVDAAVALREVFGARVGEQACEQETQDRAQEGPRVHVACLDFVEEEWGPEHDCCEHYAD